MLCLSAQGQFLGRMLMRPPPKPPQPFYLSFYVDDCDLGLYLFYFDKYGKTNAIPFYHPQTLNVSNLYATNTYWFILKNGNCGDSGLAESNYLWQWRPPLTNYVTISVSTNTLTFINPPLDQQFWKIRGTSWTTADLLASGDLTSGLWSKVWSFSYPSSSLPALIITQSNSWQGLDAYEHPQ